MRLALLLVALLASPALAAGVSVPADAPIAPVAGLVRAAAGADVPDPGASAQITTAPGTLVRAPVRGQVTLLPDDGPDMPGAALVATVRVFDNAHSPWGVPTLHGSVDAPAEPWTRVLLTYTNEPYRYKTGTGTFAQEPWDRTFRIGLGDAEVLHGTTPRGRFTITEDVTEYASLFRLGSVDAWHRLDSWTNNGFNVTIDVAFYNDPVTPQPEFGGVVAAFTDRGIGHQSPVTTTVDFGPAAPTGGLIEFITSGHCAEGEFWYQYVDVDQDVPRFVISIDGTPVARVSAMPYVYALLGFDGSDEAYLLNTAWWTVFQGPDAAGVHTGVGEIPAYRAIMPEWLLAQLQGDRDITVERLSHQGCWGFSLNFLLDHA